MRAFFRVIAALLLFAALFAAWILLFVVWPIFGLTRAAETGNPLWIVGTFAAAGLAYLLWLLAARRLSRGQAGVQWGWPWI